MELRFIIVLASVLAIGACSDEADPVSVENDGPDEDLGMLWVKHAAEYDALSMQAYHQAERALPGFVADKNWTALPGQNNARYLPPAIIIDVDETSLSGVDFQLSLDEPVTMANLNRWYVENESRPVAGFTRFTTTARAAGVELFFVTNRPCEPIDGVDSACPYEATVINALHQAGVDVDADHVLLANEKPAWSKEKSVRYDEIARTHRIIMLFGDDLNDFIPCVRAEPVAPCSEPATAESRDRKVMQFAGYWGNGWYLLPNPMHGSWTSVREGM